MKETGTLPLCSQWRAALQKHSQVVYMVIGLKLCVKKITEKECVSFTSLFGKSKVKDTHNSPVLANASVRLCSALSYLPLLVSLWMNSGLLRARYTHRLTVEYLRPFLSTGRGRVARLCGRIHEHGSLRSDWPSPPWFWAIHLFCWQHSVFCF